MGRRYRGGGDPAFELTLWTVLLSPVWGLYIPYLVGKEIPGFGFWLISLPLLMAFILFRKDPAPDSLAAKAQRNQGFTAFVLVAPVALFAWGVVVGVQDREAAAREANARALQEMADGERRRTLREAQAAAERRRVETEQRRVAEDRAVEARRTPQERINLAAAILAENAAVHDRVCRARTMLAPVGRGSPDLLGLRDVRRQLRRLESEDLRATREDARGSRMIRCCDGEVSPTCECSRSNRRGCCSWHGGICGCEPLPTEIFCP